MLNRRNFLVAAATTTVAPFIPLAKSETIIEPVYAAWNELKHTSKIHWTFCEGTLRAFLDTRNKKAYSLIYKEAAYIGLPFKYTKENVIREMKFREQMWFEKRWDSDFPSLNKKCSDSELFKHNNLHIVITSDKKYFGIGQL